MVRLSSFFLGVGSVMAQKFSLKYYTDSNCTVPWELAPGAGHVALEGPSDSCVNVTGADSPLAVAYKTAQVVNCTASSMQYLINQVDTSCPAEGMSPNPTVVGACTMSTSFGQYYMGTCSNSEAWTGATTFVITTTHAPVSEGQFAIKYYTDSSCSTPWNMSGAPVELAGPMGECLNMTGAGSPLAVAYKAAHLFNCTGGSMQWRLNMPASTTGGSDAECPATMIPADSAIGVCSYSTSFAQYYMASCSSAPWAGATTFVLTTTHAPINTGKWSIKYYTNNNCTTPWELAPGAGHVALVDAPMGECLNVTATGSPLAVAYKTAHIHNCTGASMSWNINMLDTSCPATGMTATSSVIGVCTWSDSFSQYYMASCGPELYAGDRLALSSITVATTHAPTNSGNFDLQYYTDNQCTQPWLMNGVHVTAAGPLGDCLNFTAMGSQMAVAIRGAKIVNCTGARFDWEYDTVDTNLAMCPVAGLPATTYTTVKACMWSTTFMQYFWATCDSRPWSGSNHFTVAPVSNPQTTTLAAGGNEEQTTAAANTTVAASGNEATTVAASGNEATTAAAATVSTSTVQASYEATEDLPASITAAQLLASTAYKTSKESGIANALGVSVNTVTVTGFMIGSRRQMSAHGRQLATKTVTTNYEVAVPASQAAAMQTSVTATALAASITTHTATAMAAQDWSSEPVLSSKPTVTVASTAYVGTVTAAPAVPTSTSAAYATGGAAVLASALMFF